MNQTQPKLLVSLDGGVTYVPAPEGVRVLCQGLDAPGEDERVELHLNVTHEGVLTDIWTTREGEDHNIGTDSARFEDILGRLIEDNS